MWFRFAVFTFFTYLVATPSFSKSETLANIIANVKNVFNTYNDNNFIDTYSLSRGEKVKLHIVDNSISPDKSQTEFIISLVHNYFPVSIYSDSVNILTIAIAPSLIKKFLDGEIDLFYADPKYTDGKSVCSYGLRSVTSNNKSGKIGYVIIDSNQSQKSINQCIYESVTKIFGISKYFYRFFSKSQKEYINSIGLNAYTASIPFDSEKSFIYVYGMGE